MDKRDEFRKVTVRSNGGKAHRALKYQSGSLTIVCGCPNTQNGRLANRSRIVAEGWEAANCGRSSKATSESDISDEDRACIVGMSRGAAATTIAMGLVAAGYVRADGPGNFVLTGLGRMKARWLSARA